MNAPRAYIAFLVEMYEDKQLYSCVIIGKLPVKTTALLKEFFRRKFCVGLLKNASKRRKRRR